MTNTLKYYPQDEHIQEGYLGIKLPMNNSLGNSKDQLFNLSKTTEEQAISNYINLLFTKPGERYMQPEFGVGIQRYLFEQDVDVVRSELEDLIRAQADFYLPYIFNDNIEVLSGASDTVPELGPESENSLYIRITFRVTESGANKTVVIFNTDDIVRFNIEDAI